MTIKTLYPIIAILTGITLHAEVLFQANFNRSGEPQIAKGGGLIEAKSVEFNKEAGYPFKNQSIRGADLRKTGACLIYPAKGNINLEHGTLQLWVKQNWNPERNFCSRLFMLGFDPGARNVFPQNRVGLLLFKPEKLRLLQVVNRDSRDAVKAEIDNWQPGEWHQLAVTWQKGGKKILYIDGEKTDETKHLTSVEQPLEMVFGSPTYHVDSEACLDDIRILDFPLNAKEIKTEYEQQKKGKEFALPDSEVNPTSIKQLSSAPVIEAKDCPSTIAHSSFSGETLTASFASTPIKIDGKLDEQVWSLAPSVPGFVRRDGQKPNADSDVKILYDDKYIYLGCKFTEPELDKIRAAFDQHDLGIYNDDCLELVIDPDNNSDKFWHVAINSIGGIYDSCNGDRRADLKNVMSKATKIHNPGNRFNDMWILEVAIPFADLKTTVPLPGNSWGIRVCRERYTKNEHSSYPHLKTGSFDQRKYLAKLEFQGSSGNKNGVSVKISSHTFLPGYNSIGIEINSAKTQTIELTCQISPSGRIVERRSFNMNQNESQKVVVGLSMYETDVSAIFTLFANGRPVWRGNLIAAVPFPHIIAFESELNSVNYDLNRWKAINPQLYEMLRQVPESASTELNSFRKIIQQVINNKKTVTDDQCRRFAAVVASFLNWRESKRMLYTMVSPWENGAPGDIELETSKPEFRFKMGINEWESKGLAISGLLPGGGMDFRLAVGDFYDDNGNRYNRTHLYIYQMPFIRNSSGELTTDVLTTTDGDSFTVIPGITRRFWLALNSSGMKPGVYRTKITIKPLDIKATPRTTWTEFPVTVEVVSVEFPTAPAWPLNCYMWNGGFTPVESEIPFVDFLQKHHINWMMTDEARYSSGKPSYGVYRCPGSWKKENISSNDEFLRYAAARRMKLLFAWTCPKDPVWISEMSAHLRKIGIPYSDFMFSGMKDEFHSIHLAELLPLQAKANAADTNVRWASTFTSVPPPDGSSCEQLDEVVKYINTPLLFLSNLWPQNTMRAKEISAWLKRHPELHPWIYQCSQGMQKCPLLSYYRSGPLYCYLTGTQGIAYWTLHAMAGYRVKVGGQYIWHSPDGYFDMDSPENKTMEGLCFPDLRKNVLPTRRFMALVEGLEDYAMIQMLKKRKPNSPLISHAQLTRLVECENQSAFDQWRNAILEELIMK